MTGRDWARMECLMGTLERMRLDEYVEHISNRRRLVLDNCCTASFGGSALRWASRCSARCWRCCSGPWWWTTYR